MIFIAIFKLESDFSENECAMNRLLLEDLQKNLAEVIANLHPGEVVQIISANKIVAHLTGEQNIPHRTRQPGSAIGTLKIVADDEEHLQDFRDYMP